VFYLLHTQHTQCSMCCLHGVYIYVRLRADARCILISPWLRRLIKYFIVQFMHGPFMFVIIVHNSDRCMYIVGCSLSLSHTYTDAACMQLIDFASGLINLISTTCVAAKLFDRRARLFCLWGKHVWFSRGTYVCSVDLIYVKILRH